MIAAVPIAIGIVPKLLIALAVIICSILVIIGFSIVVSNYSSKGGWVTLILGVAGMASIIYVMKESSPSVPQYQQQPYYQQPVSRYSQQSTSGWNHGVSQATGNLAAYATTKLPWGKKYGRDEIDANGGCGCDTGAYELPSITGNDDSEPLVVEAGCPCDEPVKGADDEKKVRFVERAKI